MKTLYTFRDRYFETHSLDEAIKKAADVEKEMRDTLSKFDECKGYEIDGSRAKYYYLKGKALNVVDRFVPQAEELLSKAVKLEPKLIEAWNELGECYWKNDDIKQAKNCFVGALQHVRVSLLLPLPSESPRVGSILTRSCAPSFLFFQDRNKTSLRNLSMVLRQEQTTSAEQRLKNIQQGVEYAKEAVSLDTTDGLSWAILGNAYLSSFFTVAQNLTTLRLCMSAYAQAVSFIESMNRSYLPCISAVYSPSRMKVVIFAGERHRRTDKSRFVLQQGGGECVIDRHVVIINRRSSAGKLNNDSLNPQILFQALKYQEEYNLALRSFESAMMLDPLWETPRNKRDELLRYLKDVQNSVDNNGYVKPKRLHQLIRVCRDTRTSTFGCRLID